jgi:hypothetical protein
MVPLEHGLGSRFVSSDPGEVSSNAAFDGTADLTRLSGIPQ